MTTYDYGEHDAVVLSRRVQDGRAETDGSVQRTCAGHYHGCRKLVWASPYTVKRETEIKAKGGQGYYMCLQCMAESMPAHRARAEAAGRECAFVAPTPAEWANIEKNLAPFERVKGRLLHLALFGHLPQTGD